MFDAIKLITGLAMAAVVGGAAVDQGEQPKKQYSVEWPSTQVAEDVPTPEPDPTPNKPASYRPEPAAGCDCDCLTEREVEAIAERVCKAFHSKMTAAKPKSNGSSGGVASSSGSTGGAVTVTTGSYYTPAPAAVPKTTVRTYQVRTATGCIDQVTEYSDGTTSRVRLSCPLQSRSQRASQDGWYLGKNLGF